VIVVAVHPTLALTLALAALTLAAAATVSLYGAVQRHADTRIQSPRATDRGPR
jgi:predicted porin